MPSPLLDSERNSLETLLKKYTEEFATNNHAVRIVARGLYLVGIGLRPVLDHLVFRAADTHRRSQEFLHLGYVKDASTRLLLPKPAHLEVYRKEGYPAVIIEQPHYAQGSEWLNAFGESAPYYLAVQVDDIGEAVFSLEKQGVAFVRPGIGHKGDGLRQIAAAPEMKEEKMASTLVLVERHAGDGRFYAPDFWVHSEKGIL